MHTEQEYTRAIASTSINRDRKDRNILVWKQLGLLRNGITWNFPWLRWITSDGVEKHKFGKDSSCEIQHDLKLSESYNKANVVTCQMPDVRSDTLYVRCQI